MYTISKQFHFSSSHQLSSLPSTHKCSRLHGHNYIAELVLRAPSLDKHGFVIDYGDMKPFKDYIDQTLDHRHLNDIIEVPSAENIAKHLYDVAWKLWHEVSITVRVSETSNTWAEYTK